MKLIVPGSKPVPIPVLLQDNADDMPQVVGIGDYDWPDVLVLQRPLGYVHADVIPHIQAKGVAVVVEVDDDFSAIDPQNLAYKQVQTKKRHWRHLARACEQADWVTVSTPALAERYGKHGRVSVIPNYIPAKYLKIPIPESTHTVGWSGSIVSHPGDLEVMGNAIPRYLRAHDGVSFAVVGTGVGIGKRIGYAGEIKASGWVQLSQYPSMMAQLDTIVVPLRLTPFNEAKSWLKGLEAASVGCSVVASPTDEYQRLEALGLCRLATGQNQWRWAIEQATSESFDKRLDYAAKSRGIIRQHGLIVEERADQWAEAWTAARDWRSTCTLKSKTSFAG